MATISELMQQATNSRPVVPAVFHFGEPGVPCAYWTNGDHIITAGECRCGKKFDLLERK